MWHLGLLRRIHLRICTHLISNNFLIFQAVALDGTLFQKSGIISGGAR